MKQWLPQDLEQAAFFSDFIEARPEFVIMDWSEQEINPENTRAPQIIPDRKEKIVEEEAAPYVVPEGQKTIRETVLKPVNTQDMVSDWDIPDLNKITEEIMEVPNLAEISEKAEAIMQKAEETLTEAQLQADEILRNSQNEASRLTFEAQQQGETIRQNAFDEGKQVAITEGTEIVNTAKSVLTETQNWQTKVIAQSEPLLVEMIKDISKKLFGNGFVLDPETLENVILNSITEASRLGDLRIYLHPKDHQSLITLWQEPEIVLNGQKIELISSQNILQGGCFIEGQFGIVDGRVDEQIRSIHHSMDMTLLNKENEE